MRRFSFFASRDNAIGCLIILFMSLALFSIALVGCAPAQDLYPIPIDPARPAIAAATAACGGPWQEQDRVSQASEFPFVIVTRETMRCLRDGKIVGPFTWQES